jgi:hypothetical protein
LDSHVFDECGGAVQHIPLAFERVSQCRFLFLFKLDLPFRILFGLKFHLGLA